jgi:hypothetical protein
LRLYRNLGYGINKRLDEFFNKEKGSFRQIFQQRKNVPSETKNFLCKQKIFIHKQEIPQTNFPFQAKNSST